MAEHLSMNTVIHAAVRRDLDRLQSALDSFHVGSKERATQLRLAWSNLDEQLVRHHTGEEEIFWPALRQLGAAESLVTDLDGEHERMAAALVGVTAALDALVADPSEPQLHAAQAAAAELRETIDTHFAHEEHDLEPMMPSVENTPEMKAAEQAVRKSLTLPQAGIYFAWLFDDAGPDEMDYLTTHFPAPLRFLLVKVLGRPYGKYAAAWT